MANPTSEDVVTLCNHLQDLRGRALVTARSAASRWLPDKTRAARRRTAESYRDSANALLHLLQAHGVGGLPTELVLPDR